MWYQPPRNASSVAVGVLEVALHHRVAAEHDLAQSYAVRRHRVHRLRVGHLHAVHGRVADTLPGHEGGALAQRQALPVGLGHADRGRPVGLGQAVEVGDAEAHALHRLDHRAGRCGTAGGDLHPLLEAALHLVRRVDQHGQHDRGAAEMRHLLVAQRGEDDGGIDLAQADMGAAGGSDAPGVGPAVAVEHRQRPQVDRAGAEAEDQRVAKRVQVGAAMVVDDTLRVAGGARGVAERDRFPLVVRGSSTRTPDRPSPAAPRRRARPAARPGPQDRRCRSPGSAAGPGPAPP